MLRPGVCRAIVFLLGILPTAGASCLAAADAAADSVVVRPIGPDYGARWLHRTLFGRDYRDLWTTPIALPVLDFATFGGGLTAVSRGGGRQTTSLRLRAADGNEYYFRSIDKDPAANLPPELRGTVVASVVKDQISATLPGAPLVVAPLLAAAGVLHGEPSLYILPDDPALGEFRDLAGLVGILEPRIDAGWHGATEVIGGDELFTRLAAGPDDRVDVRAFLKARLLDVLVGDWDRHRDQWSWARFGDDLPRRWVPIPRDRDYAMVHYDGLVLGVARLKLPQLLQFNPKYDQVLGLTWNGRELDRRLLMEPQAAVWDTVVAEIQAAVTDTVIADAVRQLPPPYQALCGARLTEALRTRRDTLAAVAHRFYAMLLAEAEVHATDGDETAVVTAVDPRTVEVEVYRRDHPGAARPFFARRFSRDDTREVRLFMGGGRDTRPHAGTRGRTSRCASWAATATTSSWICRATSAVPGCTTRIRGTVVTGGAPLDRSRYTPPPKRTATEIPPRDWGHRSLPASLVVTGPDIGLLFGVGRTYTTYGFRKLPYASQHRLAARLRHRAVVLPRRLPRPVPPPQLAPDHPALPARLRHRRDPLPRLRQRRAGHPLHGILPRHPGPVRRVALPGGAPRRARRAHGRSRRELRLDRRPRGSVPDDARSLRFGPLRPGRRPARRFAGKSGPRQSDAARPARRGRRQRLSPVVGRRADLRRGARRRGRVPAPARPARAGAAVAGRRARSSGAPTPTSMPRSSATRQRCAWAARTATPATRRATARASCT